MTKDKNEDAAEETAGEKATAKDSAFARFVERLLSMRIRIVYKKKGGAKDDAAEEEEEEKELGDEAPAAGKPTLADHAERLLGAWIDLVQRRAMIVLAVAGVLGVGFAVFTATHLSVDTNTANMLSAKLPWRKSGIEMDRLFPTQTHELAVVIDGDTPERAAAAQHLLVDKLRAQPELFVNVFAPETEPYFRHSGLLFLETGQVHKLADALTEAQPFIGALEHDPSLRGLFTLLQRAVTTPEAQNFDMGPALRQIATAVGAATDAKPWQLSWQNLTGAGTAQTGTATRRFIEVNPKLDFGQILPAQEPIEAIRDLVRSLQLDAAHGVRVRLTGTVALEHEELLSATSGAVLAVGIGIVLVLVLLFVALRAWQLVLSSLITLIYGLLATATFAAVTIGHLNLISVAFGVLYIGLGIDYALYLCMQYRDLRMKNMNTPEALPQAARDVGGFMTVCALTTSIGFFAFMPTEFTGIAELGLISGAGMFISLIVNLTLLPALIWVLPSSRIAAPRTATPAKAKGKEAPAARGAKPAPADAKKGGKADAGADEEDAGGGKLRMLRQLLDKLLELPYAQARALWIGTALLTLGAAVFIPRAHFDYDPLNLRDPKTESVSTYRDLLKDPSIPTLTLSVLTKNSTDAQVVEQKTSALPLVRQTLSLKDFVPTDQDAKLAILQDLSFTLGPDLAGDPPKTYTADDAADLQALGDLRKALAAAIPPDAGSDAKTTSTAKSIAEMKALRDQLDAFDVHYIVYTDASRKALLTRLRDSLLGGLPWLLADLHDALQAAPVSDKDLPPELVRRWVGTDGQHRVEIWPKEVLDTNAAMQRFVDQVRAVEPDASGAPAEYLESGRAVVKAFRHAFIYSVIAITLLLFALLRNAIDTALVLVPLIVAGLLTIGGITLVGIPFNFANVIALPLILGVGVDYGVYIAQRGRAAAGTDVNLLKTSTARAVLFGALITVANFGNLALSSHPGTRSMGLLLTIGLSMTMLTSLVLLPSLLAWRYSPKKKPSRTEAGAADTTTDIPVGTKK
jgi:hypothetical protein